MRLHQTSNRFFQSSSTSHQPIFLILNPDERLRTASIDFIPRVRAPYACSGSSIKLFAGIGNSLASCILCDRVQYITYQRTDRYLVRHHEFRNQTFVEPWPSESICFSNKQKERRLRRTTHIMTTRDRPKAFTSSEIHSMTLCFIHCSKISSYTVQQSLYKVGSKKNGMADEVGL